MIDAKSPSLRVGETTYYLCCAACRDYLRAHTQDVLAARGLA